MESIKAVKEVIAGAGYWHFVGFTLFVLGIITMDGYYEISNCLEIGAMFIGLINFCQLEYLHQMFKKNSLTTMQTTVMGTQIRELQNRQMEILKEQTKVMEETTDFFLKKHLQMKNEEKEELKKIENKWYGLRRNCQRILVGNE